MCVCVLVYSHNQQRLFPFASSLCWPITYIYRRCSRWTTDGPQKCIKNSKKPEVVCFSLSLSVHWFSFEIRGFLNRQHKENHSLVNCIGNAWVVTFVTAVVKKTWAPILETSRINMYVTIYVFLIHVTGIISLPLWCLSVRLEHLGAHWVNRFTFCVCGFKKFCPHVQILVEIWHKQLISDRNMSVLPLLILIIQTDFTLCEVGSEAEERVEHWESWMVDRKLQDIEV